MWLLIFICCVGAVSANSPPPSHPKCQPNEHLVINSTECLKTCGNRQLSYTPPPCEAFSGCVCNCGYVRPYDNATGTCMRVEECPPIPEKCGYNEVPTSCAQKCPPESCENPYTSYLCVPWECEPGCNCKPDHLRNSSGICIFNNDCPPPPWIEPEPEPKPTGECCSRCRPTCAVPNPPDCPPVTYDPDDPCQCPPGFVLLEEGGDCIQIGACPDNLGCNYDPNAIISSCASPCPGTCDSPNTSLKTCQKECEVGCDCKSGFIRSTENGECILPDDCPCGNPCNRPNEEYVSCTVSCTPTYCPTDDVNRVTICDFPSPCDSGCVCKFNYRRLSVENDTCIPAEYCPAVNCTREGEIFFGCRPFCPREFCSEVGKSCSPPFVRTCEPKCNCKDGFFKNDSDVCVAKANCPGVSPEPRQQPPGCPFPTGPYVPPDCGPNAYFEVCSFKCPPQTCPSESDDLCDPGDGCCRNECRCIDGYYKDANGDCIPADQCNSGSSTCIQSSSSSSYSSSSSSSYSHSSSSSSTVHTSSSDGCGSSCPLKCKSTCANPNPVTSDCQQNPECNCESGHVWTTDGSKCIPINECPYGPSCNGDPNAHIMERPPPCPSTCDTPDGSPNCKRLGLAVGCACNYGYLFDSEGVCVLADNCPGGNPCGVNGTFAPCKMGCSDDFCPVDDRRGYVACDPIPNCPPGCVCKYKYRWRSEEDQQCILAQECPIRECTRCDEEWNTCPSPCLDESCSNFNSPPSACNTFQEPECYPQCTCKTGYARNDEDKCIRGEDCPK